MVILCLRNTKLFIKVLLFVIKKKKRFIQCALDFINKYMYLSKTNHLLNSISYVVFTLGGCLSPEFVMIGEV